MDALCRSAVSIAARSSLLSANKIHNIFIIDLVI